MEGVYLHVRTFLGGSFTFQKRRLLSEEVRSVIKDTTVNPSAISHAPSGGGMDARPETSSRISYSQVQIGRDPTNLPPPHFLTRWLAVFTDHSLESTCAYQNSSHPEIIYGLALGVEKQFSQNVRCHDI